MFCYLFIIMLKARCIDTFIIDTNYFNVVLDYFIRFLSFLVSVLRSS